MSKWTLQKRVLLAMLVQAMIVGAVAGWLLPTTTLPQWLNLSVSLLTAIMGGVLLGWWALAPWFKMRVMLQTAVTAFHEGDYGLQLTVPANAEMAELVAFFNQITHDVQAQNRAMFQKELLLDTVVQNAPMAILLFGSTGRLILANREAQRLLPVDGHLLGRHRDELAVLLPRELGGVLAEQGETLLSATHEDEPHTYHVTSRAFRMSGRFHQLVLIKHLTPQLRRQEVATWKKIIRLINHELNNTLAPLRSLLHSARKISQTPQHMDKLDKVFDGMDRTTLQLQRFLEDYATFARLPTPRKEVVAWDPFLDTLQSLMPCSVDNQCLGLDGWFDPGQLQQAMLNLLKNAREAGGEDDSVTLTVRTLSDGRTLLQVRDHGKGMSEEAMSKALLPFYSTKKRGTGLGLPLCREIFESHGGGMQIQSPLDGGLLVVCWLPAPAPCDKMHKKPEQTRAKPD